MANYQYCVAKNWGKGFITPNDSRVIGFFRSFMGDLWKVPANNQDANRWIAGVNGTVKTLSEAQAIADAETILLQTAWDAIPDDDETKDVDSPIYVARPVNIPLEE
mgnify:FL=1